MSNLQDVGSNDFRGEVLESGTPVLADFWADWCGPCHLVAREIESLAEEMDRHVKFVKINIDQEPGIAEQYGVRSVPTLIVFEGGRETSRLVGAHPKLIIKTMLPPSAVQAADRASSE
ncbi:MAG: thioredoxin [Actinomycetota bacterium]|nr:thioredoxin [Actinomycetota bacterium]